MSGNAATAAAWRLGRARAALMTARGGQASRTPATHFAGSSSRGKVSPAGASAVAIILMAAVVCVCLCERTIRVRAGANNSSKQQQQRVSSAAFCRHPRRLPGPVLLPCRAQMPPGKQLLQMHHSSAAPAQQRHTARCVGVDRRGARRGGGGSIIALKGRELQRNCVSCLRRDRDQRRVAGVSGASRVRVVQLHCSQRAITRACCSCCTPLPIAACSCCCWP
jgi:hypothetical protein